jgi:twitching motility protein PilT
MGASPVAHLYQLRVPMITLNQTPTMPLKVLERCVIGGTVNAENAGESVLISMDDNAVIAASRVRSDGTWKVQMTFQQPGVQNVKILIASDSVPVSIAVADRDGAMPNGAQAHGNGQHGNGQAGANKAMGYALSIDERKSLPAPVKPARNLSDLVREAFERNHSDVHLGVGRVPHFRANGRIISTEYGMTDEATFLTWLREIMSEAQILDFLETMDYDGAAQYDFARVRVNLFMSIKGPSMVLRLIPMQPPTLKALGFSQIFYDICHYPQGLVLITGPTGCGKSTTMAAMVNEINNQRPCHIVTIEDPIEFVHQEDRQSVISQREVGIHTKEYDRALKAVLREDPDVILIGEMRDRATVSTALKAAQTGHLVFGTLHTNSAVKTLERLMDLFEPDERDSLRMEVSESLAAIVAQALVPTTDGKRMAATEILINTDTVKDFIRRDEADEIESQLRDGSYYGMQTRNQAIFNLYEQGIITEETALEFSLRKGEMSILLRGGQVL